MKTLFKLLTIIFLSQAILAQEVNFQLYPNPASSFINIKIDNLNVGDTLTYQILDIRGLVIDQERQFIEKQDSILHYSLFGFEESLYIISFEINNETCVKKFVKQRSTPKIEVPSAVKKHDSLNVRYSDLNLGDSISFALYNRYGETLIHESIDSVVYETVNFSYSLDTSKVGTYYYVVSAGDSVETGTMTVLDEVLNLEREEKSTINIYPNPTQGFVHFSGTNDVSKTELHSATGAYIKYL